jgi:hypothetical protein
MSRSLSDKEEREVVESFKTIFNTQPMFAWGMTKLDDSVFLKLVLMAKREMEKKQEVEKQIMTREIMRTKRWREATLIALLVLSAIHAFAQAHVSGYEVNLTWDAPQNSTALPTCTPQLIASSTLCWDSVAGYDAFRAPVGSNAYAELNTVSILLTGYSDTTVQPNQTYNYIVESVDASGVTSAPSNVAVVSVPTLSVPIPGKPTVTFKP